MMRKNVNRRQSTGLSITLDCIKSIATVASSFFPYSCIVVEILSARKSLMLSCKVYAAAAAASSSISTIDRENAN